MVAVIYVAEKLMLMFRRLKTAGGEEQRREREKKRGTERQTMT